MKLTDIPIPDRMAHLPKDRRGYPIPTMVMRDSDGRPHFQINEESVRQKIIREDLCSICGTKLLRGRWFAGGPLSGFSHRGLYIDPPMHEECVRYAMRVCPYLAAPNYGREIGTKTLKGDEDKARILIDPTQVPERPDYFVLVMSVGEDRFAATGPFADPYLPPDTIRYVRHKEGTVRVVEFWRHGEEISSAPEISQLALQSLETMNKLYGEKTMREDVFSALEKKINSLLNSVGCATG